MAKNKLKQIFTIGIVTGFILTLISWLVMDITQQGLTDGLAIFGISGFYITRLILLGLLVIVIILLGKSKLLKKIVKY